MDSGEVESKKKANIKYFVSLDLTLKRGGEINN